MPNIDAPKVSVCMTVYNGAAFLRPAIDSLLEQTHDDYEVVVVNNGSTDATAEILASYQHPRLRVVACEHQSYTSVKNYALGLARGQYVAIQDADDVSAPERLARQAAVLDADPAIALVGAAVDLIDETGARIGTLSPPPTDTELTDHFPFENPLAHSSFMFRRDVATKVGGYRRDLSYAPDFGLELAIHAAGFRLAASSDALVGLRQHSGQSTYSPVFAAIRCAESYRLYIEARRMPGMSQRSLAKGRRTLSQTALWQAGALMRCGRLLGSMLWLVRGLCWRPGFAIYFLAQQCWGRVRLFLGLNR